MQDQSEEVMIVMIEDDEGHAKLIEKNLRRSGISNPIKHFRDGLEANDFFFKSEERHPPLLILLDLNLPGIDGYEILRKLKETPKTHQIPVIILTTTDNPKEIQKCYDLGCNVYITKPVEYEAFAESIRKLGLLLAVVRVPN